MFIINFYAKEHDRTIEPLVDITPYLRSLGIDREDRVLSIPDSGSNLTLSLMDQKGYTNLFVGKEMEGKRLVETFLKEKIKYLIVNDPWWFENKDFGPYAKDKNLMGVHDGGIRIYDLRSFQE